MLAAGPAAAPAAFLLPSSAPSAPSPSLPGQRRVQGSPEQSPRPDSLTLPRTGWEGCLAPGPLQMPLPAAGSRSPAWKELPSPCSSCPSPAASASAAHIAPGWGPAIAPLRSPPHAPRSLPSPRSPAACALCIASTALRSPPATRQRRSPAPGQSRAPAAQPPLPAPSPSEGKAPGRLTNLSCPCSPSSSAPLFSASSAPRACLSRTGPRREQSLHPRASRQLGCGSRGHLSPSPNNSWRANKILKKPKKRPCGRATPASPRLQPSG